MCQIKDKCTTAPSFTLDRFQARATNGPMIHRRRQLKESVRKYVSFRSQEQFFQQKTEQILLTGSMTSSVIQSHERYLEQLFAHSRTHLLVNHKYNDAPVVHSSPPSSPGHLDVLT